MEDTGWYHVNYDNAESFQWGRNLGCEFVTKSCMEWMALREKRGESVHPYCKRVKQGNLQTECTEQRDAVALCNLIEYSSPLPPQYQYFETIANVHSRNISYYGGSVVLADYCPYLQEFTWKKDNDIVRGSRCQIEQNTADTDTNYSLERYGNRSRCFEHESQWTVQHCDQIYPIEHWGSGCYQYSCSELTGLTVTIHGRRYQCLSTGYRLQVTIATNDWLHSGSIVCPSCTDICSVDGVTCPAVVTKLLTQSANITVPCSMALAVTRGLGVADNALLTLLTALFSVSMLMSFSGSNIL
jgi:leishmanolysin-like peptidase